MAKDCSKINCNIPFMLLIPFNMFRVSLDFSAFSSFFQMLFEPKMALVSVYLSWFWPFSSK
jgi:hypothetical protein